jgi:hypothetical protein
MPVFDQQVAEYRYFVADFLSNEVIAELPFKSVSYERSLSSAGSFSGNIPVIDATAAYDLYENTIPGKTALYIVRNNECVWGGIIWSRSYSLTSRELSVNASEFTSYFYHRNIWKTTSTDYSATLVASGGVAAVTLDFGSFQFAAGMPVRIEFYQPGDFQYNDRVTVLSSPAPTTVTFSASMPGLPDGTYLDTTVVIRIDTYDYIRQLINEMLVDFSNILFSNDEIEPGLDNAYTVTLKALLDGKATLTTSEPHDIIVGQTIEVENIGAPFDGSYTIVSITDTTVTYDRTAGNISPTAVSVNSRSVSTSSFSKSTGLATLVTTASHGFSAGQLVEVTGVDTTVSVYDGSHVIVTTPAADSFTFYPSIPPANDIEAASVTPNGTAVVTPRVLSNTFGPYPGNADFGLLYSTSAYSGKTHIPNKVYRGYELRSIGEELDEYSDALTGFEYRIDCAYDPNTQSFTRTFVVVPIDTIEAYRPLEENEVPALSWLGADQYVFEYPGNIMDVNIDESAEDAATRFFVVGSDGDLGADASQPYSVASAVDLLDAGWPLLDADESKNDVAEEDELYDHAYRYLNEFRPPVSDFTVTVNGSLAPVVGSYSPGDWCSLIIDDPFVQMRLASALEPRDEIIVRKIDGYSVSVPDNPSFPEQVSLRLVTEWEVDQVG